MRQMQSKTYRPSLHQARPVRAFLRPKHSAHPQGHPATQPAGHRWAGQLARAWVLAPYAVLWGDVA